MHRYTRQWSAKEHPCTSVINPEIQKYANTVRRVQLVANTTSLYGSYGELPVPNVNKSARSVCLKTGIHEIHNWISLNCTGVRYFGRQISHICWISWISWIPSFRWTDLTNAFKFGNLLFGRGSQIPLRELVRSWFELVRSQIPLRYLLRTSCEQAQNHPA